MTLLWGEMMSRWLRMGRCLLPLALALGALAARAQPSAWQLSVEVNTDFPLSVGGRLGAELPGRLRLSTTVGYLPPPYLRAINSAAVELGTYDAPVADLIEATLRQGLVWRTHVGWRPVASAGFFVDAGYGLLALRGDASPEEVLVALTGIAPPEEEGALDRRYEVHSTLHMVDVELGWRWVAETGVTARLGIGAGLTFAASSTVEPRFEPTRPALTGLFTGLAERYLDTTYERYVHFPTVSLSVGYAF